MIFDFDHGKQSLIGKAFEVALDANETEEQFFRAVSTIIANETREIVRQRNHHGGWLFTVNSKKLGVGAKKVAHGVYKAVVSQRDGGSANTMAAIAEFMTLDVTNIEDEVERILEIDLFDYQSVRVGTDGSATPPPLPAEYYSWD